MANGFTSSPTNQRTFPGLITSGGRATLFHPRFTRGEVEFGNLSRRRNSGDQWSYLSVQLAVPVPHLVLKSHRAGDLAKQLPVWVAPSQRLPLEGDFDSWFHAYAPSAYERDALFILVPDVMAALIDSASTFHIELIDHRVTFFVPGHRRFTDPESWRAVDALLQGALPPIASAAVRYRDERVPGQNDSLTVAAILAAVQSPGEAWVEPRRVVDARGARLRMLDFRTGWWGILRGVAWAISMVLLYVVPGLFLFAAIMSIVDGH